MTEQRPSSPPFWDRLPKHIRGTRIRTSTAILVVLFVVLMWWYLNLRVQFVPEEQRRTGAPAVTATVDPTTAPRPTEPLRTSTESSSAASSTVPRSGASQTSGAPQSQDPGTATTSGSAPSGASTSPSGISIPGLPGVTIPGLPGQGNAVTGAPTTPDAPR